MSRIVSLTVNGRHGRFTRILGDAESAEATLRRSAKRYGVREADCQDAHALVRAMAVRGAAVRLRGAPWPGGTGDAD